MLSTSFSVNRIATMALKCYIRLTVHLCKHQKRKSVPQETFDARTAITAAPAVVGMAALWMSLYKRLLYPVMFSFQRTGFDGGMIAQGVYALVFVTALFALYAFRGKAARALVVHKWIAVVFGVGGVIGLFLLTPSSLSGTDTAEAFNVGSVLVALYIPVHLAFWTSYAHLSSTNHVDWTLVGSFALFLAVNIALIPIGGQSAAISVACPIASTLMIVICRPIAPAVVNSAIKKTLANELDVPTDVAIPVSPTADASSAQSSSMPIGASPTVSADAIAPAAPIAPVEPVVPTAIAAPAEAVASTLELAPAAGTSPSPDIQVEPSPAADASPASTPKPEPAHDIYEPSRSAYPKSRGARQSIRQFGKDFGLSDRESELAAYAYRNYSARKIAGELFIAESTVYTHLKRIYKKTGVHSKAELIDLIDEWKGANGFGER